MRLVGQELIHLIVAKHVTQVREESVHDLHVLDLVHRVHDTSEQTCHLGVP